MVTKVNVKYVNRLNELEQKNVELSEYARKTAERIGFLTGELAGLAIRFEVCSRPEIVDAIEKALIEDKKIRDR